MMSKLHSMLIKDKQERKHGWKIECLQCWMTLKDFDDYTKLEPWAKVGPNILFWVFRKGDNKFE